MNVSRKDVLLNELQSRIIDNRWEEFKKMVRDAKNMSTNDIKKELDYAK